MRYEPQSYFMSRGGSAKRARDTVLKALRRMSCEELQAMLDRAGQEGVLLDQRERDAFLAVLRREIAKKTR